MDEDDAQSEAGEQSIMPWVSVQDENELPDEVACAWSAALDESSGSTVL